MVKSKGGGEVENGGGSSEATTATTMAPGGTTPATPDSDNISTRVGSRTKKAKVVFDPSDLYVPRKRVRKSDLAAEVATVSASPTTAKVEPVPPESPSSDAGRVATFTPTSPVRNCDMCHKVEQQRRGFKLIDCSNCAFRAHSKCLRAHPMYSKFPIQFNFRCFQCIECVVCSKSLRGGKLLFCCDCQNAFHQNCHGPVSESESTSSRSWVCKQCSPRPEKKRSQSPVEEAPPREEKTPTPKESKAPADDEAHQDFAGFSDNEIRKDSFSLSEGTANESNDLAASIKEEVLDTDHVENGGLDPRLDNFENVQSWTCDDVYRYFKHHFPDYAHLFKEQEIDGPSLVLMRKSDVLSGFGLKLGPAITLYQRIVMMQNNDPDFRLTWI